MYMNVVSVLFSGDDEEGETESNGRSQNLGYEGVLNPLDVEFSGQKREDEINIEMRASRHDPSQLFPTLQEGGEKTSLRFWALVKIRFLLMVRSKAAWIFMLCLPVGLVAGGLVLNKQSSPSSDMTPVPIMLSGTIYARSALSSDTSLPGFFVKDSVSKCNAIGSSNVCSY